MIKAAAILMVAGLSYLIVASKLGGIPCVFHLITGLKCPGCGVTRMLLSMLRGNFKQAFSYNSAVFCMIPFGLMLALSICFRYVFHGKSKNEVLRRLEYILTWGMLVILILFGIIRNVIGI